MWHVQLSGPLPLPVSAFVFYPPFPAWSEYLLDTGAPKLPHHKLWNRSIKSRYFVSVPGSMMLSMTQALLNTCQLCNHMPIPVGPVCRMPGTSPTELDMVFVRPTMKDVVKLQHREGSAHQHGIQFISAHVAWGIILWRSAHTSPCLSRTSWRFTKEREEDVVEARRVVVRRPVADSGWNQCMWRSGGTGHNWFITLLRIQVMLQLERRRNARRYCTYTVALDVTMMGSQFSPRRIFCHVTMPTKRVWHET